MILATTVSGSTRDLGCVECKRQELARLRHSGTGNPDQGKLSGRSAATCFACPSHTAHMLHRNKEYTTNLLLALANLAWLSKQETVV
jgi:hypothetical protein